MSVATAILQKEFTHMLKYYIKATEALHRLRTDKDGVVSFEYVIVACLIIVVVGVAFSKTGPLNQALTDGINQIATNLKNAI
jgi:pilus assembly protein Flp/PilA